MPKAIARISREKRIDTLAQNLFVVDGPGRADRLARAARALLRENPWLADREAFHAGATVIVPSDLGIATTERVERPNVDFEGILQETTQRLKMARTFMRDGFARGNQEASSALARLEEQELTIAFRRQWPESSELLAPAAENVRQQLETNDERQSEVSDAIDRAMSEIDRLRRLARQEE